MASHSSANANVNAPSEQKHVTPVTIAVDFVICGVFFGFMFGWLKPHVPSYNPLFINFFAASTTICITGVLWMALQMFRIVSAGEKTLKAERAAKK